MRVHALILAAGQSRRFGGGKLHALYRGRPLLSYVLDVVEAARKRGLLDGGHVVVAAGDERALTLARGCVNSWARSRKCGAEAWTSVPLPMRRSCLRTRERSR